VRDFDFDQWVTYHTNATGGGEATAKILEANRKLFALRIRTTLAELCLVTDAIVESGRIPEWPREHLAAVIAGVRRAREEAAAVERPDPATDGYTRAPRCPACGGCGLVVVPHPACVSNGRLCWVKRYPKRVLTTAVACDDRGCKAGVRVLEKQNPDFPLVTHDAYRRATGMMDGPAALASRERFEAEKIREREPGDNADLFASLRTKAAGAADAA
jgi:hypothetical protein